MADLSIDMLPAATGINDADLSILFQSGVTKKVTGTVMIAWLTQMADGHGGIQSVAPLSTSGLKDTYRITLADTATFDFTVTNGKGISSITPTGTYGLVDTYTITYNDSTTSTFTVTNGAKGDKGDNAYVWVRYASQEPTASSHDFGVIPDKWMGVYSGNSATAPTDYTQYQWFQIKGEKGDTGDPALMVSQSVTYQASTSANVIPSGNWSNSIPTVAQGAYLWTRVTMTFNSGNPVYAYSVSRMGLDGTGAVSTVAGVSPDSNGNVALTAGDIDAIPASGGTMTGELVMGGSKITELGTPEDETDAANKGYVDGVLATALPKSGGTMTGNINMNGKALTGVATPTATTDAANKYYVDEKRQTFTATLGTTWAGSAAPYTQTVSADGILATDFPHITPVYSTTLATALAQQEAWGMVSYAESVVGGIKFTCLEDKPTVAVPIQIEVMR